MRNRKVARINPQRNVQDLESDPEMNGSQVQLAAYSEANSSMNPDVKKLEILQKNNMFTSIKDSFMDQHQLGEDDSKKKNYKKTYFRIDKQSTTYQQQDSERKQAMAVVYDYFDHHLSEGTALIIGNCLKMDLDYEPNSKKQFAKDAKQFQIVDDYLLLRIKGNLFYRPLKDFQDHVQEYKLMKKTFGKNIQNLSPPPLDFKRVPEATNRTFQDNVAARNNQEDKQPTQTIRGVFVEKWLVNDGKVFFMARQTGQISKMESTILDTEMEETYGQNQLQLYCWSLGEERSTKLSEANVCDNLLDFTVFTFAEECQGQSLVSVSYVIGIPRSGQHITVFSDQNKYEVENTNNSLVMAKIIHANSGESYVKEVKCFDLGLKFNRSKILHLQTLRDKVYFLIESIKNDGIVELRESELVYVGTKDLQEVYSQEESQNLRFTMDSFVRHYDFSGVNTLLNPNFNHKKFVNFRAFLQRQTQEEYFLFEQEVFEPNISFIEGNSKTFDEDPSSPTSPKKQRNPGDVPKNLFLVRSKKLALNPTNYKIQCFDHQSSIDYNLSFTESSLFMKDAYSQDCSKVETRLNFSTEDFRIKSSEKQVIQFIGYYKHMQLEIFAIRNLLFLKLSENPFYCREKITQSVNMLTQDDTQNGPMRNVMDTLQTSVADSMLQQGRQLIRVIQSPMKTFTVKIYDDQTVEVLMRLKEQNDNGVQGNKSSPAVPIEDHQSRNVRFYQCTLNDLMPDLQGSWVLLPQSVSFCSYGVKKEKQSQKLKDTSEWEQYSLSFILAQSLQNQRSKLKQSKQNEDEITAKHDTIAVVCTLDRNLSETAFEIKPLVQFQAKGLKQVTYYDKNKCFLFLFQENKTLFQKFQELQNVQKIQLNAEQAKEIEGIKWISVSPDGQNIIVNKNYKLYKAYSIQQHIKSKQQEALQLGYEFESKENSILRDKKINKIEKGILPIWFSDSQRFLVTTKTLYEVWDTEKVLLTHRIRHSSNEFIQIQSDQSKANKKLNQNQNQEQSSFIPITQLNKRSTQFFKKIQLSNNSIGQVNLLCQKNELFIFYDKEAKQLCLFDFQSTEKFYFMNDKDYFKDDDRKPPQIIGASEFTSIGTNSNSRKRQIGHLKFYMMGSEVQLPLEFLEIRKMSEEVKERKNYIFFTKDITGLTMGIERFAIENPIFARTIEFDSKNLNYNSTTLHDLFRKMFLEQGISDYDVMMVPQKITSLHFFAKDRRADEDFVDDLFEKNFKFVEDMNGHDPLDLAIGWYYDENGVQQKGEENVIAINNCIKGIHHQIKKQEKLPKALESHKQTEWELKSRQRRIFSKLGLQSLLSADTKQTQKVLDYCWKPVDSEITELLTIEYDSQVVFEDKIPVMRAYSDDSVQYMFKKELRYGYKEHSSLFPQVTIDMIPFVDGGQLDRLNQYPVLVSCSPIRIPYLFTDESLNLKQAILGHTNAQIFKTKLIGHYIEQDWKLFARPYAIIQSLLFLLYLITLIIVFFPMRTAEVQQQASESVNPIEEIPVADPKLLRMLADEVAGGFADVTPVPAEEPLNNADGSGGTTPTAADDSQDTRADLVDSTDPKEAENTFLDDSIPLPTSEEPTSTSETAESSAASDTTQSSSTDSPGLFDVIPRALKFDDTRWAYLSVVLSSIFLVWEILQMFINTGQVSYWTLENVIDIGTAFLGSVVVIANLYEDKDGMISYQFTGFASLFMSGKVLKLYITYYTKIPLFIIMWSLLILKYSSSFEGLRFYVRMVREQIIAVQNFIYVFFIFVLAYTHMIYIFDEDSEQRGFEKNVAYRAAYATALGENGNVTDWTKSLSFFAYVVFSFLITVVVLNTVIAIMASRYDEILENEKHISYVVMLEKSFEFENLFSYFSRFCPCLKKCKKARQIAIDSTKGGEHGYYLFVREKQEGQQEYIFVNDDYKNIYEKTKENVIHYGAKTVDAIDYVLKQSEAKGSTTLKDSKIEQVDDKGNQFAPQVFDATNILGSPEDETQQQTNVLSSIQFNLLLQAISKLTLAQQQNEEKIKEFIQQNSAQGLMNGGRQNHTRGGLRNPNQSSTTGGRLNSASTQQLEALVGFKSLEPTY